MNRRCNIRLSDADDLEKRSDLHVRRYHVWHAEQHVYVTRWEKSGARENLAGITLYVHGISDYGPSGRVLKFLDVFLERSLVFATVDLYGHGYTTGTHVGFTSVQQLVDSVTAAVKDLRKVYGPTLPIHLFGMSLGGLVVLQSSRALKDEFSGIVAMCPLVEPAGSSRPPVVVEYIAKALRFVAPTLAIAAANRGQACANIEDEEAFLSEPLTYSGKLRVGAGMAMLDSFTELQENLASISLPLFVIQGTADRVVTTEGAQRLYNEASSADKTIKLCEGKEHNLFTERDIIIPLMNEIADWIASRSKKIAQTAL